MLVATALLVGAANSLNCWLERESDAFMKRTRKRAAAGRPARSAARVRLRDRARAASSLPLLIDRGQPDDRAARHARRCSATSGCTRRSSTRRPYAMVVGAVPGALPPLMGWTAVTGEHRAGGGLVLFAIVFVWQMPHVIGLSSLPPRRVRRGRHPRAAAGAQRARRRAGTRSAGRCCCLPVSARAGAARDRRLRATSPPRSCCSRCYFGANLRGLLRPDEPLRAWGRRVFLVSLLYLPLLLLALMLDKAG